MKGVVTLAERIRKQIASMQIAVDGKYVRVTASFGVTPLGKWDDEYQQGKHDLLCRQRIVPVKKEGSQYD